MKPTMTLNWKTHGPETYEVPDLQYTNRQIQFTDLDPEGNQYPTLFKKRVGTGKKNHFVFISEEVIYDGILKKDHKELTLQGDFNIGGDTGMFVLKFPKKEPAQE